MKFKILIIGGILAIVIIALLFVLQKEEVKVHDVDEAFSLLKENYSISNDYSVINITNGWKFEFLKVDGNCSLECVEKHIYFEVYKNGSVIESEKSTNITKIENENDALNYVLYKFPKFKNISKCEFEEKLMCHEDIIIEKINDKWNITFMNESKGCNNECVIEHYYSFVVEKDGNIVRSSEREKMIILNYFAVDVRKCNENLTLIGAKWWANPEEAPADATLTLWYFENIGKPINIESTYGEARIILCGLPHREVLVQGTYIIDGKPYFLLIDTHSNTVYRINKTESVYNILLEKFSTKTINNESDVLEAFERHLRLFGLGKIYYVSYSTSGEKLFKEGDYILYKPEEFKEKMKCEIYRKNKSWALECKISNCIGGDYIKGNWKAKICEKGGVYMTEKNISVTYCPMFA